MRIKEPVKNRDSNVLEINIILSADEVDYINGCIRMFQQTNKGDTDDPKQQKLQEDLKEGFYLARRKVKP